MYLINSDSCQKLPYQVEASKWSVVPYLVPFIESFTTRTVLTSTNHPRTSPTSIHSFKTVARTSCAAVKDFNQKLWILSGPAPFQSGVDFNFLLISSLVIFTVFYFSDGIFSFALSIHSTSCLCSTFVHHIPFENAAASSTCGGFVLSSLTSRILKKSSLVDMKIFVVLKLFCSAAVSFYFSGFCSYSLFQFFHYECKLFSSQPIILI